MGLYSKIQWCDSAANPTSGCDGCELWIRDQNVLVCYSGRITERAGGSNPGLSPVFEMVIPRAGRMKVAARWSALIGKRRHDPEHFKPWLDGLPRLIFLSDMGDALSKGITFEFIEDEIFESVISQAGQQHVWLWLTKQPKKMAFFSNWLLRRGRQWPNNLWAGTSVTSQATVGRVADILRVGDGSTKHFVSLEPQYGVVEIGNQLPRLDWLIHGGQSAHELKERAATPAFNLEWVRALKGACAGAGVPYFLKQLGAHVVDGEQRVLLKDASHGAEQGQWPDEFRDPAFREMPRGKMMNHRSHHVPAIAIARSPGAQVGPK